MQEEVCINNVKVPIIKEGGIVYYPISYLGDKVLLKDLSPSQLRKNGYDKHIKMFKIDYGEYMVQDTYCISEKGLKEILSNSKIGRLNLEQKRAMNKLLEYLGLELIMEDERFIKSIPKEKILEYPEYIQDCINEILESNENIMWQKCIKCNIYYPYHINFFRENRHSGKEFPLYTFCRDCCGWTENRGTDWIRLNNTQLSHIYRQCGIDTYKLYKNNDIIGIYKDWLEKQYSKSVPEILNNKKSYLEIIKYLYQNNKITLEQLTIKNIKNYLPSVFKYIKAQDVYNHLFNNDPYEYPWKYPNFQLPTNLSINQYNKIFNNYLKINNIKIENIYDFNYSNICSKCGLQKYALYDILGFVMKYYNNKYPAYKFKIQGINYWKNKDNRVQALKYLIEEDMKLPIEKIPLYLTLTSIRTIPNNTTLYNVLKKYYKEGLWEWVNEVYPDRFIKEDFNVTVIRNVFDSAEEHTIHDILIGKFINVIYNQRNVKSTITIAGIQPDWFIITDNGIWVVEYFGINVDHKVYNKRTDDYKKKAVSKIERYKDIKWLGKVYLYPDDLKDNFKGLEDKLKVIV